MKKISICFLAICLVLMMAIPGKCGGANEVVVWSNTSASWTQYVGPQYINQTTTTKTYENKNVIDFSGYGSIFGGSDQNSQITTDRTVTNSYNQTHTEANLFTVGGSASMTTSSGATITSANSSSGAGSTSATGNASSHQSINMSSNVPLPNGGYMSSSYTGSQSSSITVKTN